MKKNQAKKQAGKYNYNINIQIETVKTQMFIDSLVGFDSIH